MTNKVLFIFPRLKYPSGDFSLGLAYLISYIRKKVKDIDLSMVDTSFNPSLKYVDEEIKRIKPQITIIYSDTLMFKDAIKVAEIAKKRKSYILLGGPHATVMPDTCFKTPYIDAICIGEGEIPLYNFLTNYFQNKDFTKTNGFWVKKGIEIIKNPPGEKIDNLDNIPFPAVDLFDVKKYVNHFVQLDSYNKNLKGLSLIVSRGCPYKCSYCQPTLNKIFGKKLRLRSPQNVIDELIELKKRYKINAFYFQDDTFTAIKKWVTEFCELMIEKKMNLLWACNTRADTVDYDMLKFMKKAGCVKVKVGIESINDRIRNGIYKKGVSKEKIINLIKNCKKLKIQVTGFFMLGAPTETEKEVWDTIKFAVRSDLNEANFSITTPLPETDLYNDLKEKGGQLPSDFNCFDYYQVKRPKMTKDEISIEKLKLYKKIANFYFYLHPKRIINTLKQILGISGLRKAYAKIKRI